MSTASHWRPSLLTKIGIGSVSSTKSIERMKWSRFIGRSIHTRTGTFVGSSARRGISRCGRCSRSASRAHARRGPRDRGHDAEDRGLEREAATWLEGHRGYLRGGHHAIARGHGGPKFRCEIRKPGLAFLATLPGATRSGVRSLRTSLRIPGALIRSRRPSGRARLTLILIGPPRHHARSVHISGGELGHLETSGTQHIVGLAVQATTAGDTAPERGEPTLPGLHAGFG